MSEETSKNVVTGQADVFKTLTPGAKRFSEYYAVSGNGRRASILAGFHADYCAQLLQDNRVLQAIEYYREAFADSATYNPEKLVRQWAKQASFSPAVLLNDDWSLKELDELDEEQKAHFDEALLNFEIVEKRGSRTIKPKFNKQLAQEHLGRLMKMYEADKMQAQGMVLNISVGAGEATQEVQPESTIGNIRITQEEL